MNAEKWMHALEDRWVELPPYFITSSEKKLGRDDVLDYIDQINKSLEEAESVCKTKELYFRNFRIQRKGSNI